MSDVRHLIRAIRLDRGLFGAALRVTLALVTLLAAGWPTAALARPAAVSSPELAFRPLGHASTLVYNERYVLATSALAPPGSLGTLYDDASRTSQVLTRPGCTPGASSYPRIGGPLLFECSPGAAASPELYFPARHRWQSVVLSPAIADPCAGVPDPSMCDVTSTPLEAGSRWLEASEANCPQGEHCRTSLVYQNLQSGAVATDPSHAGGRYVADLNSPQLAQRLCPPLRVPLSESVFAGAGPGEIIKLGRFAIGIGTDSRGVTRAYLDLCGSRVHELLVARQGGIDALLSATTNVILWLGGRATLSLESLPSRHRSQIRLRCCGLPRVSVTQVAVTDRRVYVLTSEERLWAAVLPRTLRPR